MASRPLIAEQLTAVRLVIPHAQTCSVDRQLGAHADLAQCLFRTLAAAPLVDFGQCAGNRLGQQEEVLLEHIVDCAGAHHLDGVLLAVDAGEKNERRVRGQAPCFLQRLAAGKAGQDEVGEDQVEPASLQRVDHSGVVVGQFYVQLEAGALQGHLCQLRIMRAVLDEQDTDCG